METKMGKIEGLNFTEGDSPKGHWKRMAYIVDGHKFSTFDDKLHGFAPGQYVKLTFTKSVDGKFNNITTMEKTTEAKVIDNPVQEEHIGGNDVALVDALKEIVVQLKRIGDNTVRA